MLDLKLLRSDPTKIAEILLRRGFKLDLNLFNNLEQRRKLLQTQREEWQSERNKISKFIGQNSQSQNIEDLKNQVKSVSQQLAASQVEFDIVQDQLQDFLDNIPNLLSPKVPDGSNEETDNIEIKKIGEIKKFDFKPLDHVDLGEKLGGMDFAAASKIAGSRFVVLKNDLARLQRAVAQFMLNLHVEQHGYQEINPPFLVHERCLYGNGQLPKFKEDLFGIEKSDLYLTPTAEAELANLTRESILEASELPLKFTAHTPCFRSEAGSYGKDTRGMIRQHQFEKVELVQVTTPETSEQALQEIVSHAEKVLQLLKLPYRVILKCAGDTGFSSLITYDLEVWLPGQQKYREISSCSSCGDFQARRMQTRYRADKSSKKLEYVHTLNGSGLAVGRTVVAIMENYQNQDGSITIPEVLLKYFPDGKKIIK